MTTNNTTTRVAELSATLSPLPEECAELTPDMIMLAEDCNSYNSSFYINGRWIKPCFNGDFQGCFLQSVDEYQVLRFFMIETELEGLAYDEIPENWDEDEDFEMPEMIITGFSEYKQVWICANAESETIILDETYNNRDYREESFVIIPNSFQPWIYEPKVNNLVLDLVNEHEDSTNDFSLTYHLSTTGELLARQAPQFNQCVISLHKTDTAIRFFRTFRVALRHHYQLPEDRETARLYLDYLSMLNSINHGRMTDPQFICPTDIHNAHARILEQKAKADKERERREAERKEADFREHHSWLFGIEFDNGHFHFKSLDSVEEYRREGEIMHHCIYAQGYYNKHDYLSMHISDLEGNRVATCTIDLKRREIEQIQTICNNPQWRDGNEYKEIWNVLMARMHTFPKRKQNKDKQLKIA